jgi:hypothetical protein
VGFNFVGLLFWRQEKSDKRAVNVILPRRNAIDHQIVSVQVKPVQNAIPKKGVMGYFSFPLQPPQ